MEKILPLDEIDGLDLHNKTILEVGTGNGGTTLDILQYIQNEPSSHLITTDLIAVDMNPFLSQYPIMKDRLSFIQTDATELLSIEPNSIDIIIVDYTMCAINSISGKYLDALNRFKDVLKPNGLLLLEEEFPIDSPKGKEYPMWKMQWRILKKMVILTGKVPNNEIPLRELKESLKKLNFHVEKEVTGTTTLAFEEVYPHFSNRFDYLLSFLPNIWVKGVLTFSRFLFRTRLKRAQFLHIPSYTLQCRNLD
ncbi:MAG: class I SAM-dependent methyltransferase [Promethearchaeota archaeon]